MYKIVPKLKVIKAKKIEMSQNIIENSRENYYLGKGDL